MKRQVVHLGADQAMSSLITLVLSVYAARESTVTEFGVFSVAYAVFWVLLGLSRAFVGEVNLITGRESLGRTRDWRCFSIATSIAFGLLTSIALLVASLFFQSSDRGIPWSFTIAAPAVVLADAVRYIAFTDERYGIAVSLDAMWLVATIFAGPAIAAAGVPHVEAAVLGWAIGAALASSVVLKRYSELRPRLKGALKFAAGRLSAALKYSADFLAASGIGQAATVLIPVVASLAVAGGLRAGYVLIGPLNVVYSAMIVFLIPRLRGACGDDDRAVPSPAPAVVLGFAGVCALYLSIVLALPSDLGTALLGQSWYLGRSAVPMLTAAFLFISVAQVMVQVMRLRRAAGLVVRIRVFSSTLNSGALLLGAVAFGTLGAATGSAVATFISLGAWWMALAQSWKRLGGSTVDSRYR